MKSDRECSRCCRHGNWDSPRSSFLIPTFSPGGLLQTLASNLTLKVPLIFTETSYESIVDA